MSDAKTIVSLHDCQPDPRNANKHTPRGTGLMESSIRECGYGDSLTVDRDGRIISGNQRAETLADLGMTDAIVVQTDGTKPVIHQRMDLDLTADLRAKKLALYQNRVGQVNLDWDVDVLQALQADGVDLSNLWHDEELDALVAAAQGPMSGLTDSDEVPTARHADITAGDLFELGRHRLLCADSTLRANVARLMGEVKAHMVFSDPPYGMQLDTDFSSMRQGNVYRAVAGDDQPYDPAHIFETFDACPEIVLWGADYYAERIPQRNAGSWFVWDKANGGDAPNEDYDKMFGSNFELAWSKTRHKRALVRILWKGFFGLSQEDTKRRVHPTQKPTELARWFFDRFTEKDGCVVDLFLGSGSSLIAAEQTARRCFAIELDPSYCQVSIDRWEAFVGNGAKAVKVGDAVHG